MMELGACVSLLEKCHTLGYDRMQQEKTKVHISPRSQTEVIVRPFPSLQSSRVFVNAPFVYSWLLSFFLSTIISTGTLVSVT